MPVLKLCHNDRCGAHFTPERKDQKHCDSYCKEYCLECASKNYPARNRRLRKLRRERKGTLG